MIELFVKRPVTTVMFVSVFIVLGIISYFNLTIDSMPKVEFPIVTVKTIYPGATPFEVETQVTDKIEEAISELSEIKKTTSRSFENFGLVIIEFNLSADVNVKSIEVKDKVEAIINELPGNVEKPLIEKFDPLVKPIMELVLTSDKLDGRKLYHFADKTLKTKLASIEGVANIQVYGGKERQINIFLDPLLMKKHYITIDEVTRDLRQKNMDLPGGSIDKKDRSINVRFIGEFKTVAEIGEMKLVNREGNEFYLKDVATITDGSKKVETNARFNAQNAVGLSIKKISDGNAVEISKKLRKMLPSLRKILPPECELKVAADTTKFIIEETKSTENNILIGILLTVIILYLFTANLKLTFIASVVIPASVISTLFLVDSSKFTINMMTLLAIATALGTLIANAIVIVESVLVHLDRGKTPQQAAIDGTKEVTVAVLASTGTNLVVFTPIAFMGGIIGQFMKEFGLTVVYATVFSLLASFTLTPMLCGVMLKKRKKQEKEGYLLRIVNKVMDFLKNEYNIIFNFIFRFPKSTLLFSFLILFSSKFIFPYIGNDFFPPYDQDKIIVDLTLPQGTTLQRTLQVTKKFEEKIKDIPEVTKYLSNIGQNGTENAFITVSLKPSEDRTRSDADIINSLIPFSATFPDVEVNMLRGEGKGEGEGDISINVYGDNYEDIIAYSKEMKNIIENSGYFRSVESSYKNPKKEMKFIPNQQELIRNGIKNVDLASVLRASLYGDDTNVYKEKGNEYKINVQIDDFYRKRSEDLEEINVITSKGMLPISKLGKIEMADSLPTIRHRDRERVIRLNGLLSKSTSGHVIEVLDKKFKDIKFKKGDGYKYVGNAEIQDESTKEIVKAFILATILTYMILAAIMNSFLYPFTIVTSIATSFVGVYLMLFFMDHPINIASMLAMIMLVGLVVNSAILILDYSIQRMKEGVDIIEALRLGTIEKFRAVLMTSIAIIFGTLPQLRSVMIAKASMGTVIVGGMLASIFFTFILIPIAFWYVERFRRFIGLSS